MKPLIQSNQWWSDPSSGRGSTTTTTRSQRNAAVALTVLNATQLVEQAQCHRAFLRHMHASGITTLFLWQMIAPHDETDTDNPDEQRHNEKEEDPDQVLLQRMLDRYLDYWLPLVAAHSSVHDDNNEKDEKKTIEQPQDLSSALMPPPDCAWLWHCHRLSPLSYRSYCRQRYGTILEATVPFGVVATANQSEQQHDQDAATATKYTQDLWHQRYPHTPFFLDLTTPTTTTTPNEPFAGADSQDKRQQQQGLLQGLDLLASASRQASLWWHISQPQFDDPTFLRQGVERYGHFLALVEQQDSDKQHNHNNTKHSTILVPTYQIDWIWHTHIALSVSQYLNDCQAIRGSWLSHDDSLGDDRSPGASLDVAFRETCRLWKQAYPNQDDYIVAGAMYRGPAPVEFWDPSWTLDNHTTTTSLVDNTALLLEEHQQGSPFHARGLATEGGNQDSNTTKEAKEEDEDNDKDMLWKEPKASDSTFIPPVLPGGWGLRFDLANPLKRGHVFGKAACCGVGYYSLDTQQGMEILSRRLLVQAQRQYSTYDSYMALASLCGTSSLCCSTSEALTEDASRRTTTADPQQEAYETELTKTLELLAYVQARQAATGPRVPLSEATVKHCRAIGARQFPLWNPSSSSSSTSTNKQQQDKDWAPTHFVPLGTATSSTAHHHGPSSTDAILAQAQEAAGCGGGTWYVQQVGEPFYSACWFLRTVSGTWLRRL